MTKAHHLKARKSKAPTPPVPLNFLLGCSQSDLDNFQMARLAEVADLRRQMLTILDRLIDQTSAAALAQWFRTSDRQALKHAIENEESPIEWAQRLIQQQAQRNEAGDDLIPLPKVELGAAHLAAAVRYQERNIAEGLCAVCPEPLAHNSVRYCEKHLTAERVRHQPKNAKGSQPGSIGWLHGEGFVSQHGRQPGTLQSLAMARKKKSRAVLAQLGWPPESAATALEAAKAALLEHMPHSEKDALMEWELFDKANISDSLESTAKKALQQLFSAGQVQRIGKGVKGDPFLYFTANVALLGRGEGAKKRKADQE
jgi:hypothetical protein